MIVPIDDGNGNSRTGVPKYRNTRADDIVEQLRFLGLDEAADEIERLRAESKRLWSLISEWAYWSDERAIHLRSGELTEEIDKRHYDSCEALVKAVGFPRLAPQEFETDDLRRDLPA